MLALVFILLGPGESGSGPGQRWKTALQAHGGAGDNVLYGGAGNDELWLWSHGYPAHGDVNKYNGGPGDDELEGYSSKVKIEFYFDVSPGFGTDTIDRYYYGESKEKSDRIYLCGDANTIEFRKVDPGYGSAYRIQVTNNGVKAGEIRQRHPHSDRKDVHISIVPATTPGCTP